MILVNLQYLNMVCDGRGADLGDCVGELGADVGLAQ
jgi:hypothetical protein